MKKLFTYWKCRFAIWMVGRSVRAWVDDVVDGVPEVSLQKIADMREQMKNEKYQEDFAENWLKVCDKLERYCQAKIQMRDAFK